MNPGPFANLQLINVTSSDLVVGPNVNNQVGFNNTYQMSSWFPGIPGTPLVSSLSLQTYNLQFSSGVGDEDDAADSTFAPANDSATPMVWFHGGTFTDSAHYLQFQADTLPSGHIVFGSIMGSPWNSVSSPSNPTPADPSQVQWFAPASNTGPFFLGVVPGPAVPGGNAAFAIVDLDLLFPQDQAGAYYEAIQGNDLSSAQSATLFDNVAAMANTMQFSFSYNVTDIDFPNALTPPQASSRTFIGNDKITLPENGEFEKSFSFSQALASTFSLTSTDTVSLSASLSFELPVPFLPSADISGSFTSENGETSTTTSDVQYAVSETLKLQGPGSYDVEGFVSFVDNYSTQFSAEVIITGSVELSSTPVSGLVLSAILKNPDRNDGYNVTSQQVNETSVTATLSGMFTGSYGINTVLEARKTSSAFSAG